MNIVRAGIDSMVPTPKSSIKYLSPVELEALTESFRNWYEETGGSKLRAKRAKYWLVFLTLRYTGARLQEVLLIDDVSDVDFRNKEIRLVNLKRRRRIEKRQVPVPAELIAEIARVWAEFPELKGKLFKLDPSNFRKVFLARAKEAGLPREVSHPHVLRHTRAVELLRAGVPITAVQQLLGHAFLSTTAVYLRLSNIEVKQILQQKGLI